MDLSMGGHFSITSASLSAFDTIAIIILVPIYDRLLIPLLTRYNLRPTYLQRIGIGLVVRAAAFQHNRHCCLHNTRAFLEHGMGYFLMRCTMCLGGGSL